MVCLGCFGCALWAFDLADAFVSCDYPFGPVFVCLGGGAVVAFPHGYPLRYPESMTQPLATPTNSLALAGFILGCVAVAGGLLVPGWTLPLLLFVAAPGLLAIIFGFVGVNTANRLGGKRKHLAVWAVVLGFSPVPAWMLSRFLLAVVFGV